MTANPCRRILYFDLDGPIIDVSKRYYYVHQKVCNQLNISSNITMEAYWNQKRAMTPLGNILYLKKGGPVNQYKEKWLDNIEKKDALILDEVFSYAKKVLNILSDRFTLNLITLRRNAMLLDGEMRRLGLNEYFTDIFVVKPSETIEPHVLKFNVLTHTSKFNENVSIVGDTEVDILAGRMAGIKSIGVLSGIRNRRMMERLSPVHIVSDIRELLTISSL